MTNKLAQVFHFDLYGKREAKYDFLNNNSLDSIEWNELDLKEPSFYYVPKDFKDEEKYFSGFKMDELIPINCVGIATGNDSELISTDSFIISEKFNTQSHSYSYRPFDVRHTVFDNKLLQRSRFNVMKNLSNRDNLALQITSKNRQLSLGYVFISNTISDRHLLDSAADSMNAFPLYLYPETNKQADMFATTERTPNLNAEIVKQIAAKLDLIYSPNPKNIHQTGKNILQNLTESTPNSIVPTKNNSLLHPIDILDYIYAVLHSPSYREKYKEFLKIDFPRVPYPKDKETFWKLVKLGGEIRQIHLLESAKVTEYITQYPIDGDNVVGKVRFEASKVWINETQYFDNVPEIAWSFYIGGYQPAQKWLKDRKERVLNFEDIFHYQKIIVALSETDRLMKEIDSIEIE